MKVLGGGSVHVYESSDEGPHQVGPHELWQESVVLLWWDLKQSIGGFYRIGHELGHKSGPMIALWSSTVTPQGIFKKTSYLPLRPQDKIDKGFGSGDGSLRYDYDGNCVWTLEDQDIKARLRVHDFHPSIDCYPKKGALSEVRAAPHGGGRPGQRQPRRQGRALRGRRPGFPRPRLGDARLGRAAVAPLAGRRVRRRAVVLRPGLARHRRQHGAVRLEWCAAIPSPSPRSWTSWPTSRPTPCAPAAASCASI